MPTPLTVFDPGIELLIEIKYPPGIISRRRASCDGRMNPVQGWVNTPNDDKVVAIENPFGPF